MTGSNGIAHPTVWLLRAGERGRYASDFVTGGVAAIGWPAVGDVKGRDRGSIIARIRSEYPDEYAAGAAGALWRFVNEIENGDVVLAPDAETRAIHVGRVTGPYEFRKPGLADRFPHVRAVGWERSFNRDDLPQRVLYTLGSLGTLSRPSAQDALLDYLAGNADEPRDNDIGADIADDKGESVPLYEDLRQRTAEIIGSRVARLDAYETQNLFAGILRALGYFTEVSPPGADGGTDIVASKDALGVEPPIIRVQVKARPAYSARPNDVRELAGLLADRERGIVVSTGGFTRDARNDARIKQIQLIGMDRLVELLLANYDKLDPDTATLVPLRRLWVP